MRVYRSKIIALVMSGAIAATAAPAQAGKKTAIGVGIGIGVGILLDRALKNSQSGKKTTAKRSAKTTTKNAAAGFAHGLSTTEISGLQRFLAENGFDPGEPDGQWGGKTVVALNAWQKSIGDSSSSVMSPRQRELVFANGAVASTADSVEAINSTGDGVQSSGSDDEVINATGVPLGNTPKDDAAIDDTDESGAQQEVGDSVIDATDPSTLGTQKTDEKIETVEATLDHESADSVSSASGTDAAGKQGIGPTKSSTVGADNGDALPDDAQIVIDKAFSGEDAPQTVAGSDQVETSAQKTAKGEKGEKSSSAGTLTEVAQPLGATVPEATVAGAEGEMIIATKQKPAESEPRDPSLQKAELIAIASPDPATPEVSVPSNDGTAPTALKALGISGLKLATDRIIDLNATRQGTPKDYPALEHGKLLLLLLLAADPEVANDDSKLPMYLNFLDQRTLAKFVREYGLPSAINSLRANVTFGFSADVWRGKDEFEIGDTKALFREKYVPAIKRMAPQGLMKISFSMPLEIREYDRANAQFGIGPVPDLIWQAGGFKNQPVGLQIVRDVDYPSAISLDENQARALKKFMNANVDPQRNQGNRNRTDYYGSLWIKTVYAITAMDGATMSTEIESIAVHGRKDPGKPKILLYQKDKVSREETASALIKSEATAEVDERADVVLASAGINPEPASHPEEPAEVKEATVIGSRPAFGIAGPKLVNGAWPANGTWREFGKLRLLLMLKARPGLSEDISFTRYLLNFVDGRTYARFRRDTDEREQSLRQGNFLGNMDDYSWVAKDEFEVEDKMKELQATIVPEVRKVIPNLPIRFTMFHSLTMGPYNRESGSFPLGTDWNNGGFGGMNLGGMDDSNVVIEIDHPLASELALDEANARKLKKFERANSDNPNDPMGQYAGALMLRTVYDITEVSYNSDEKRFTWQAELQKLEVVGRKNLQKPFVLLYQKK
jgi:hypothetical protein